MRGLVHADCKDKSQNLEQNFYVVGRHSGLVSARIGFDTNMLVAPFSCWPLLQPAQVFDDLLLLPIHRADELAANHSVAVDDVRFWNLRGAVLVRDR